MKVLVVSLLLIGLCYASPHRKLNPLSEEFISEINKRATTWKAGKNFDVNTPLKDLHKRLGLLPARKGLSLDRIVSHDVPSSLPESLDLRKEWSNCSSLREIRNQGSCGSCWAFASVEVMTDRTCIHSNGKMNFHYSAQDLTSCCKDCGSGCFGGYLEEPFDYWTQEGIVSGGPFDSNEGCSPYLIADDGGFHFTPVCVKECQEEYDVPYKKDLHFGREGYYQVKPEQNDIMYELSKYGSVSAAITVYDDFFDYESGVYVHKYGEMAGGHAIKILGYGEEDGTPYWLCANSWGYEWGDKGFFKLLRGENHCGIEERVIAGFPKL